MQPAPATQPPGALKLGDRGDGTPGGKMHARLRYAHLNRDHVPDIIRHGANPHLYEYKCPQWHVSLTSVNHGGGRPDTGGGASTADGHLIALGGTEEHLREEGDVALR